MARLRGTAALLAVASLFALTRCTPKAPPPEVVAQVCQSTGTAAPQTINEIRIYQDVTESMRGFLMAGQEPPYHKFLDSIDMAALGTGSRNISFWQFGTAVDTISRDARHDHKTYLTRAGYENNDYKVVFAHTKPSALTILVTDLFQSDNDFTGVAAEIESRYFSPNKTTGGPATFPGVVAILGTKLAFKGPIYDVGRVAHSQFQYNGARPIYVLAFGAKDEVTKYMKALKASLDKAELGKDVNVLVVSPDLVTCLPSVDVPLVNEAQMKEVGIGSAGGLAISNMDVVEDLTSDRHPLMKQFLAGAETAHLDLAVPVTTLAFVPALSKDALVVNTSAERLTDQSPAAFQNAPEAADAFRFDRPLTTNVSGTSSVLRVGGDLHTEKLTPGKVYRFSTQVELDRDRSIDPPWVGEWSFSPPKQDGSKTENLAPFLFTLRSQMTSRRAPIMLRAFFYVKRR